MLLSLFFLLCHLCVLRHLYVQCHSPVRLRLYVQRRLFGQCQTAS